MLKNWMDGLRTLLAAAVVLVTLTTGGCAWIQSGERLDESTAVRDGQDLDEMNPIDPTKADIPDPEVNQLP